MTNRISRMKGISGIGVGGVSIGILARFQNLADLECAHGNLHLPFEFQMAFDDRSVGHVECPPIINAPLRV